MKTKIVITDIISFILGIVMFFVAFTELLIFTVTSDIDKISISCFALALGLRHIQDSTTKIDFKEEK